MPALPSLGIYVFLVNSVMFMAYMIGRLSFEEYLPALIYLDGVLFPILTLLILGHQYRIGKLAKRQLWPFLSIAGFILALLGYVLWIEPNRLYVARFKTEKSQKTRLKIVHISDLLTPKPGNWERRLVRKINALQPDICLFTGNFIMPDEISLYRDKLEQLAQVLKEIEAPLGKYWVKGDQDYLISDPESFGAQSGFRLLIGDTVHFTDYNLHLVGLPLNFSRYGEFLELDKKPSGLSSDTSRFLVAGHYPDFIRYLEDDRVYLAMAGHVLGGVVHLPGLGPFRKYPYWPEEHYRGLFYEYGVRVHLSPGLGSVPIASLPPIRLGNPPTISLIEIP